MDEHVDHLRCALDFRKERFPNKRKTKLMPIGDGPFEVLERLNDKNFCNRLFTAPKHEITFSCNLLLPRDRVSSTYTTLLISLLKFGLYLSISAYFE
uniref:Putative ovule protein n=1 Tax=Solanum chacoense TaxID=4108 RepID=A0A0V0H0K3_SOLCH